MEYNTTLMPAVLLEIFNPAVAAFLINGVITAMIMTFGVGLAVAVLSTMLVRKAE